MQKIARWFPGGDAGCHKIKILTVMELDMSMSENILAERFLTPPQTNKNLPFGGRDSRARSSPDDLYDVIARQRFFANLKTEQLELIRSLSMEVNYGPDEWIFREGDPANRFFIILKGYVSVELECERGIVPIRNLGPGDDLGWAWLFPPYCMHFSARTTVSVRAIFFYGTRLREACEQDHELGYELMKRVAGVLVQNLKATEWRVFASPRDGR
jgi:CRP/FNR family transcriptional regulator, cyclic AMP receptor protein